MKSKTQIKNLARTKRKYRIRKRVFGTAERPRLAVFRSHKNIYAQLIDDVNGATLASASSLNLKLEEADTKTTVSNKVGNILAESAKKKNISKVIFDRAGYKYHGRVKALADGARKNGLEF